MNSESILQLTSFYSSQFMYSQHPAGSQTLINLGAVDFLTSFRHDVGDDSGVLQLVDSLISKLFYIHTDDEATKPNPTYTTKAATCEDNPSHCQDGTHIFVICYLKNWEKILF